MESTTYPAYLTIKAPSLDQLEEAINLRAQQGYQLHSWRTVPRGQQAGDVSWIAIMEMPMITVTNVAETNADRFWKGLSGDQRKAALDAINKVGLV